DLPGRDALSRARRALRAADAELDLTRIRALADARAPAPGSPLPPPKVRRDRAIERASRPESVPDRVVAADPGPHVEVVLRRAGHEGGRRRARPLAWGLAAAAAVVAVGVTAGLTLGVPPPGGQGLLPGGAPAQPGGPASILPPPGPTRQVTPTDALARAAWATADGACDLTTRSTLDADSALRTDTAASAVGTPKVALGDKPLGALQQVTVATVLNLPEVPGRVDDEVAFAAQDTRAVLRVRITPDRSLLLGGEVTRIDLYLDLDTSQPRGAHGTTRAGQCRTYLLNSELCCAGCTDPPPPAAQDWTTRPTTWTVLRPHRGHAYDHANHPERSRVLAP